MEIDSQKEKRLQAKAPLNLNGLNNPTLAASPDENPILKLQRTVGNQAVQRLIKAKRDAHTEAVQPVGPDVQNQIEAQKGGGELLPADTQSEMEQELGGDLTGVRLHTDSGSAELTSSLGARAFTQGRDIFFARGIFDQNSLRGRETLTHELTHVVDGRTHAGGVQRDPADNQGEIQMPPMYLGKWGPIDVNPYYAAAQVELSRYFEFQRGLVQLLIRMRDIGFREFKEASDTEYNKKEDSFLLKLFELALVLIPAAGGLLKTFQVLSSGSILGDVGGLVKGASEVGSMAKVSEGLKTAEKVGEGAKTAAKVGEEGASVGEKVLTTTEGVKGAIETGKKTKELGAPESQAEAKGNFSMEVLHNLAELDAQRWTASWADELKLAELLENHRRDEPTVDLEANFKAILDTLYGPMVVPGDDVIVRSGEIFELQLYNQFYVEEMHARHLFVNGSDYGIQGIPDGVQKRISKLNGWAWVVVPMDFVDIPADTRLKAGMKF
ncbi:MAG: DUF4157 domain-containing protein [Anaerolineaceae bacterium]|nr:DUF4157 domain-containing protein [Anaerolineaceae bacterium]